MTTKGFIITGRAAHDRIARLFVDLIHKESQYNDDDDEWIDLSPYATSGTRRQEGNRDLSIVEFLWENSPRHGTKGIRDDVKVYSHLPNGTSVLDDKWVLARLLGSSSFNDGNNSNKNDDDGEGGDESPRGKVQYTGNGNSANNDNDDDDDNGVLLATLESHCFRGADFATFARRVGLLRPHSSVGQTTTINNDNETKKEYQFRDLMTASGSDTTLTPPPPPDNLWVIKDAMSNGAGGIWIVDSANARDFLADDRDTVESAAASAAATSAAATAITSSSNSNNNSSNNNSSESILHPTHRYVAQKYAWPPTLYRGRKCHLRVYGCINYKGEAFVHRRAFLHVANELFSYDGQTGGDGQRDSNSSRFEPSVHITNCCANSHDVDKFSGEICANLLDTPNHNNVNNDSNNNTSRNTKDIPLGQYFPSIAASLAELARKSRPFLKGGGANRGFEYLGMDFVLSSLPSNKFNTTKNENNSSDRRVPVAYLLEVNAPPSQDTATGLSHAEELHDEVLSDLLKMCVLPELLGVGSHDRCGGWQCVYRPESNNETTQGNNETAAMVVPSKAAFVNRVRWNMFEKRAAEEYELYWSKQPALHNQDHGTSKCESSPIDFVSFDHHAFIRFARSQFPYFTSFQEVFFESGGGSQVPQIVMDSMMSSLACRDRSVVGSQCFNEARRALLSLLTGADMFHECSRKDDNLLFLGLNATSLLERLAQQCFGNVLKEGDEIILASENHLANVLPWTTLAKHTGAVVKWWTLSDTKTKTDCRNESCIFSDLVTPRTKLVAISHASNILGCVRDVPSICRLVRRITLNRGQVVVDGVCAAPHLLSSDVFIDDSPDWYVVSLHKMFGPHMGCLIGKKRSLQNLLKLSYTSSGNELYKLLEMGTMNYEACAGGIALQKYFQSIESELAKLTNNNGSKCCAKLAIQSVESILVNHLLSALTQSTSSIHIIQDLGHQHIGYDYDLKKGNHPSSRLPFVSFTHAKIKPNQIVEHCRRHGVICRACKFLSSDRLWREIGIGEEALVRFSLVHYNTLKEIDRVIDVLSMMDGWA